MEFTVKEMELFDEMLIKMENKSEILEEKVKKHSLNIINGLLKKDMELENNLLDNNDDVLCISTSLILNQETIEIEKANSFQIFKSKLHIDEDLVDDFSTETETKITRATYKINLIFLEELKDEINILLKYGRISHYDGSSDSENDYIRYDFSKPSEDNIKAYRLNL